jgi:two-component system, cell cycle sensor histidine kinase and response regulator CckA
VKMSGIHNTSSKFEQLRNQAEELIRQQPDLASETSDDVLELLHELNIHQAELEIQNEELKRAQQVISELHREYENLYEFAPCGYVTLTAKGIITRINLAGVKLLGSARQTVLHSGFSQCIASGWEDAYWQARKRAAESGEKQSTELLLKSDKRSPFWVRAEIQADRNETGRVDQWRMVLVDITDKKAAERALKESEERFRELFENAPVAYQLLDRQGNFIAVNETWLSMLGYSKEEITGRNFKEFLHPDWKNNFNEYFARFKAVGESLGAELVMRKKNGADILVSLQCKIDENARDDTTQIHCVFYDITAQRKAEEDKKMIEDQLRQAQKMKAIGTLAGGIAHDFNNLLMAIQGRASLLSFDLEPAHPLREHLEAIEESVRSAAHLTRQLLGFARGGKYEVKPVDINELVTTSSTMFGRTCKEVRIYTRAQSAPIVVDADRRQIEQVLLNMFVNAWQAMPDGGELYLETSIAHLDEAACSPHQVKPGGYVKIAVTDTGTGMDETTRQQIFDPFFTTKEKGHGVGLGLASSYGIIKNHGGIITVSSELGHGSTFNILLPVSEKIPHKEISFQEKLAKGSETVLLVDDEVKIIEVAKPMLELMGYHVISVQSGEHAVDVFRLKADEIDLVILDLIMPGMDGGKVFDRIRDIKPAARVILSSGYAISGPAAEIMQRGCNGFIQKPYAISKLSQIVRKILDEAKQL